MKTYSLCGNCKTGMEQYLLDKRAEVCPYLASYINTVCAYYTPFSDSCKKSQADEKNPE